MSKAVGDTKQILAEADSPVIIYSETRKNADRTSKSIRIDVDSASALDQYFFEARKNKAFCAGLRASFIAPYVVQGGIS
ncbi:hypothetical protein [Mesorhizobium sp.]|uniref:hypothetical protein n=1 Tax=Mesorhizobium sp. TaxID=1871066 RepID=UPI00120D4B06|nr:hypothetical protein [Mesorhizobium sp.]TIO09662.1 MAG: hypothetical protein E5X88_07180 [Mesorhizobium sp.]TIO34152.1 MAG: hypothetical protein E5X89_12645 [Mesorhizobium sp.]TIP11848.1 MAG: hypothetical protein E5X73_14750 [Mesorhizobium sp.]